MEKRPELNKEISVKDFQDFYWYKEELIEFCRIESLDKRGDKIELSDRIEEYLRIGVSLHNARIREKTAHHADI